MHYTCKKIYIHHTWLRICLSFVYARVRNIMRGKDSFKLLFTAMSFLNFHLLNFTFHETGLVQSLTLHSPKRKTSFSIPNNAAGDLTLVINQAITLV